MSALEIYVFFVLPVLVLALGGLGYAYAVYLERRHARGE